jgi:uncharacterized protein (TIGR02001 family)
MKKLISSAIAALAVTAAAPALAADFPVKAAKAPAVAAPSVWDIAFGSSLATDYVWRGVTQSDHEPSVAAYFEPRVNINPNLQLYAGVAGESIKFANDAAAEIDFYGGLRPTVGPLAFDIGLWYYYYPGGKCFSGGAFPNCADALPNGNFAKADASFYEVYGKVGYTAGAWAFGINENYSPNFLNTGAWGNYTSGTLKFTAPENLAFGPLGWYVSGEFGRQWLGTSDAFYSVPAFPEGIDYKDYNTWNVGLGLTWKTFTLDLRYSDTDLNEGDCNAFTSDPSAGGSSAITPINPSGLASNWCGATFIAKLSADLTLGSLK